MTKKITAYGSVVVAALVMGFALLTAASAAPSVSDGSIVITGDTTQTLTATNASQGFLTGAAADGTFSIVTQPADGGSVSVSSETATTIVSTAVNNAGGSGTGATIDIDANSNIPSSGYFFIDDGANIDDSDGAIAGLDAGDEIVSCTGKNAAGTALTGCTRGIGNTSSSSHADNTPIFPIAYTVIAIDEFLAAETEANVADASVLQTTGRIVTRPAVVGNAAASAYTGKSGSTLVGVTAPGANQPVGTDVMQFGRTVDTAVVAIDADSGFAGSFMYEFDYDLVAGDKTITVTVISDLPVANDVEGTVAATLPTPLPILLTLGGTDSSEDFDGGTADLTFTSLPTKGLLGSGGVLPTTVVCVDVSGAAAGEVQTNCSRQVLYTPLAGATGTDMFTYTIENGGDTSAEATVTIILPGGSTTPTPGAGFADAIVPGLTATTYGGGTVDQLGTDAAAAGATSVSVTNAGAIVTYVVGAPAFVNQAFSDLFPTGVPAGQIVLVVVTS